MPSTNAKGTAAADKVFPYAAAQALVGQMTLDEKLNITRPYSSSRNICSGNTGSVPRLGWPGMCIQDAGNGVRAAELVNSYPSGIHAGASWDRRLTYQRGREMGLEFRRKGASSNIDDRTLHEFYFWPFMDGVRAGAANVMCSYNRVNNTYACENSQLINGLLKTELGFQGFVISDWNAQYGGITGAIAGVDMVMPEDQGGYWVDNITQAISNKSFTEARVDDMATRILAAWYLTGQNATDFPEPGIGIQNLSLPHALIDARSPESKPVLLEGAIAGHVLVKNINNSLPLGKPTILSIFGYDAQPPPTKSIDTEFQLGYESEPEMAKATLGYEAHFSQYAPEGVIFAGGRSGSNSPSYIDSPFGALTQRAKADSTYLNWDLTSGNPDVNPMSDACLVFINAMATEGWDRDGLHDDFSDGLVLSVASKCANTIVIVHAAGIRLVDQWIEHPNVTAAVIAHLPGQDIGEALVSILYGEVSPSGKLPYTLARNESDYGHLYGPCVPVSKDDHSPQCNYTEGVYVDYRHFDANNIEPRFEFGFGLSYTSFGYDGAAVRSLGALDEPAQQVLSSSSIWDVIVSASVRVTNTGPVTGEEVAQLYVGIPGGPAKQLRGFEKVKLGPGEQAAVTFELTRRDLSIWDVVAQDWVVQPGRYVFYIGASSRDIRWNGTYILG
ncbi:hypothetical protein SLS53_008591 [Cytospora paraplurivora]|uniref:beta-glucosidase n=1 Tax=Cytospora paraplurivora TaxID=2898453 RepID=A0AAN9TYV0_9PEZI